jgi:predicted nucleotidyltransferase
MTTAGIISQLQKELADIVANQPILLAYLYGSQARSKATALSDVDIALITDKNLPALTRLDLEFEIEEELTHRGIANPDVRIINQAPLSVRGRVITGQTYFQRTIEELRARGYYDR